MAFHYISILGYKDFHELFSGFPLFHFLPFLFLNHYFYLTGLLFFKQAKKVNIFKLFHLPLPLPRMLSPNIHLAHTLISLGPLHMSLLKQAFSNHLI